MSFFVLPEGRDSPHDLRIWSRNWTNLENSQQYLDQHLEISKLNEKTKTKEAFDISSLCVSKQSLHPFVIAQSPPKLNLKHKRLFGFLLKHQSL